VAEIRPESGQAEALRDAIHGSVDRVGRSRLGVLGASTSQRVYAVARIRIGPAVDPGAIGALIPQAVGLALDTRVVRHLLAVA